MYNSQSESPWYKLIYYGLEFFGRYYSSYGAIVVDNNDPLKLNRVKLVYPQLIKDDTTGNWAYPKALWGGKNYGIQVLPQVGDIVYVEFAHGDLEYPMWVHGSYGEGELPTEFSSPNIYGFKTPNGNIILIDDNDESGNILVKFKTSNEYIKITKDILELESKLIKLGKEGKEAAILGDTLKEKLDSLFDKLGDLQQILATHSHPGNGSPPSQAAQFIAIRSELGILKQTLTQILSNKVKLD